MSPAQKRLVSGSAVSVGGCRATMTTRAPSETSRCEMASPIPFVPPVTIAVFAASRSDRAGWLIRGGPDARGLGRSGPGSLDPGCWVLHLRHVAYCVEQTTLGTAAVG